MTVQRKVGRALEQSAWFLQETFPPCLFSCSVTRCGITYVAAETEVSLVKPCTNME